jgi:hypothetical protein
MLVVTAQKAQSSFKSLPIFCLSLLDLMQLIDNDAKLLMIARYSICHHEISTASTSAAANTTIVTTIATQ